MATTPKITLTCTQCGYVNEPERVYCHNCGVKLDRSVLPKEEAKQQRESLEETRRRVKRMTNPQKSPVLREFKALAASLFWGAVVAALIQIVRPPADVPDPKGLGDRLVASDLAQAIESPQPRMVQFSEKDVNAYLKSLLRGKPGGGWMPAATFERMFVGFDPGFVRISLEQKIFGYSIYTTAKYDIGVRDNTFYAKLVGVSWGRLALHPSILNVSEFAFKKVWPNLKREHTSLQRMQSIKVEKGTITMVSKPAPPLGSQ